MKNLEQKIKSFLGRVLVGGALAVSPLIAGCEDVGKEVTYDPPLVEEVEEVKYDNNPAEGHAVASGTWYKPEEGTTDSGWRWSWGYFYLEQDGTNVWGFESWEFYGRNSVEGFVDGDKIHLKSGTDENPIYFDGSIDGNILSVNKTTVSYRSLSREYNKQGDHIPRWAW